MKVMRIRRWIEMGAAVGASFALLALTDVRQMIPYPIRPSDRIDFYLCRWMLLGFAPWPYPIAFFYLLVVLLNVCTYALLFLIIGVAVRGIATITHAGTPKIRGEQ
jgi:hypothetical protein